MRIIGEQNAIKTPISENIDLLFMDGGEFTSDGDFLMLWHKANVIVLDDCNERLAVKNCYAMDLLIKSKEWTPIHPGGALGDRNGWAAFRKAI